MDNYFYFEPRTGIWKAAPIRSNFYVYRLPWECREYVASIVREANLNESGLAYPDDFAKYLDKHDTKWDQKSGLAVPFHAREY